MQVKLELLKQIIERVGLHLHDGRYVQHPKVKYFSNVTRLRLEFTNGLPKPLNLDGVLSETSPARSNLGLLRPL